MPGPFTHPGSFIPGEDSRHAGTLRKLQELHEILKAVDDMGGQQEPDGDLPPDTGPFMQGEPGPERGPWNPKHPKFSAFMQKWGPLVQMGGAAIADIGNDAEQPRIDTGRVVNRRPSSVDELRGQWAYEGEQRRKAGEKQQERRDTFHRESMLNRRAMLPTILSALLKDDKEPDPEKKATAQALLEFTEQQEWFQKLDEAEKNRVRRGILKVKEEDEDLSPHERAYQSERGRIDAEIESGGRWKPDKETEQLGDSFEREMYGKLLSKTQGPLEDPMTPEKAAAQARQARERFFGPKPQMQGSSGAGGAGAGPGAQNPGFVPPELGDLAGQYPDVAKVPGALGGMNLPPFEMQFKNYTPAPQAAPGAPMQLPMAGGPAPAGQNPLPPQAGPSAAPPVQAQAGGAGPMGAAPPGGMPPQAMSPQNMRPMQPLLMWDRLVSKLANDPNAKAKLQAYRQAFMDQYKMDPVGATAGP